MLVKFTSFDICLAIDSKYYVSGMGNFSLKNESMHVESIKRYYPIVNVW